LNETGCSSTEITNIAQITVTYAAFTLSGFDDQEQNLTFVKTDFQVLKLKLIACSMKQVFYPLHKQNITRARQQEGTFLPAFCPVPGCQTCMCKRSITPMFGFARRK